MKRNKWSVSRFKTQYTFQDRDGVTVKVASSYGPNGKYRFESYVVARLVWFLCRIESLFTGHRPWLSYIPTYSIDTEMGIDFADAGPWRSYHLETSGDSFNEMVENATVSEVDQDGGTIDAYGLSDASSEVENACLRLILDKVD